MKKKLNFILFLIFISTQINYAQLTKGIKYKKDYFVFEPEITKSDLGSWVKRTPKDFNYYKGDGIEPINKTYLEFTGNSSKTEEPNSPLIYRFKAPKTGEFRVVMRMYQPIEGDEKEEDKNDVYIKLEGKFTSACKFTTVDLTKHHKAFGRCIKKWGVRKWGTIYGMEGFVNDKKVFAPTVYNLIKGEVYTFTMAGKANACGIDYILFYDKNLGLDVSPEDLASTTDKKYRP